MRKRRRLADKLTISVCAVLVAVSAFFYAPMDVSASESINFSLDENVTVNEVMTTDVVNDLDIPLNPDLSMTSGYFGKINSNTNSFVLSSGLNSNSVYKVVLTIDSTVTPSVYDSSTHIRSYSLMWNNIYNFVNSDALTLNGVRTSTVSRTFFIDGATLMSSKPFTVRGVVTSPSVTDLSIDFSFNISVDSVEEVSNDVSDEYQNGYNAGYSAGEQAGYGNGYSEGYESGYSAGESAGYDKGVSDSTGIDVNSYYNAGYTAGYNVGYSEGYDLGYDEGYLDGFEIGVAEGEITGYEKGYEDALEYYTKGRVSNVPDFSKSSTLYFSGTSVIDGSVIIPTNYTFLKEKEYNIAFDISWTSQVKSLNNISGTPSFSTSAWEFDLCGVDFDMSSGSGHFSYDFIPSTTSNTINMSYSVSSLYFPADWSTAFSYSRDFNIYVKNIVITSKTGRTSAEILEDMERQDLNTQNTIRDGFSDTMHGWDDSSGSSTNNDLSTGLNEFETAENSLFASATTGMKDFTFFDIESVPAMLTAVTFITSIMGSWFEQAGGASGVGIVLSILFSVMLVSMVLGLYRLYQSAGHRAAARERHSERMGKWKKGK